MRNRLIVAAVFAAMLAGVFAFALPRHYKVQPGGPNIPASQAAGKSIIGDVRLMAKSVPNIDPESKDISGYQTTRWTQSITATFNLPSNTACAELFQPRSPGGDGFALTLGPAEESNAGVSFATGAASTVGLSFVPTVAGCGLISPSFRATPALTSSARPRACSHRATT